MDDNKKTEPESPVALALKAELAKLLSVPLTLKQMHKIRRVADAGAKTLMALTGTENLRHRRFMGEVGEEDEGSVINPVYGGTFGQSNGESYGVTMIREIISAASAAFNGQKTPPSDPVQLVQAIAVAREKGLTDIEDSLRSQLHTGPQTLSLEAQAAPAPVRPELMLSTEGKGVEVIGRLSGEDPPWRGQAGGLDGRCICGEEVCDGHCGCNPVALKQPNGSTEETAS